MKQRKPRWTVTPRSNLQRAFIEGKAEEKEVSVSEIIRQLIDKAMEEEKK